MSEKWKWSYSVYMCFPQGFKMFPYGGPSLWHTHKNLACYLMIQIIVTSVRAFLSDGLHNNMPSKDCRKRSSKIAFKSKRIIPSLFDQNQPSWKKCTDWHCYFWSIFSLVCFAQHFIQHTDRFSPFNFPYNPIFQFMYSFQPDPCNSETITVSQIS